MVDDLYNIDGKQSTAATLADMTDSLEVYAMFAGSVSLMNETRRTGAALSDDIRVLKREKYWK